MENQEEKTEIVSFCEAINFVELVQWSLVLYDILLNDNLSSEETLSILRDSGKIEEIANEKGYTKLAVAEDMWVKGSMAAKYLKKEVTMSDISQALNRKPFFQND